MDIRLHYLEKGKGTPLLLLHGNGESAEYFEHQISFFSEKYHVYALDTRGHGKSPRGEAPFTLEQFALDLEAFMDEKGLEQADILGFSDGANIALLFALRHPPRVGRLILNGANLFPKGVKNSVQLPIVMGYLMVSLIALFSKKAVPNKEMLGLMVTQPHIVPEELLSLQQDPYPEASWSSWRGIILLPPGSGRPSIKAWMLFCWKRKTESSRRIKTVRIMSVAFFICLYLFLLFF